MKSEHRKRITMVKMVEEGKKENKNIVHLINRCKSRVQ